MCSNRAGRITVFHAAIEGVHTIYFVFYDE